MEIRIKETKEVKYLCIRDKNGTEWTADLVLGADETIVYNKEDNILETSNETYEWWKNYIEGHVKVESALDELMADFEDLGMDDDEAISIIESVKKDWGASCDYNDHYGCGIKAIEEARETYLGK
jgi:hypothetical protein